MREEFYVYVAGPLSDMPPQYLANVARLTELSRELVECGYVTICPAADMLEGMRGNDPWPLARYQDRSLALLRLLAGHRAALYVDRAAHADGRLSGGVAAEVKLADKLGIPVVASRDELRELRAAG